MKKILLLISFAVSGFVSPASPQEVTAEEIVRKLDRLYRSDSSYAEIEMRIVNPNWERTLRMKAWSEGMEKTFIRITYPPREEGIATLRIENQMWNYLPNTNKVIKIPPSMMMSSWMGSDFTNNDLVREYTYFDDYEYSIIDSTAAGKALIYLQMIPKEGVPIVWNKIIISVRKQDYLPVKEEYYDEAGELIRVINFSDIKEFDGRKIPSVIELVPQTEEGSTLLKYIKVDFNADLPEGVFSLQNLRRR